MEDFVYEVIVDICARTFKLRSSDGNNKIIACEDSAEFMRVLEVCDQMLEPYMIKYAELSGDIIPDSDNKFDLGSSTNRWANIYSADLQLSNVGTGGNEIDGTEGISTLQEAEDEIFLINRKNGKRYKIKMEEV